MRGKMKTINFSPEEQELLKDILECCLTDLRMEIAGTDLYEFKRSLQARKSLIKQLLKKIETAEDVQQKG
jgi:hypothetical protein